MPSGAGSTIAPVTMCALCRQESPGRRALSPLGAGRGKSAASGMRLRAMRAGGRAMRAGCARRSRPRASLQPASASPSGWSRSCDHAASGGPLGAQATHGCCSTAEAQIRSASSAEMTSRRTAFLVAVARRSDCVSRSQAARGPRARRASATASSRLRGGRYGAVVAGTVHVGASMVGRLAGRVRAPTPDSLRSAYTLLTAR